MSTLPRGTVDMALEEHVRTFAEKQRPAVLSLDNRMREKLGRHFIGVEIYPVSVYMEPKDVHGRKLKTKRNDNVISIQASAGEFVGDIQASAEFAPAKFLTPDEAAAYLGGLNSRTVTRWAREGYLPSYPIGEGKRRLWRFLRTDLEEWMLARRQGGQNAA